MGGDYPLMALIRDITGCGNIPAGEEGAPAMENTSITNEKEESIWGGIVMQRLS